MKTRNCSFDFGIKWFWYSKNMFSSKKIDAPFSLPPSPSKKPRCWSFKNIFQSSTQCPQEVYFESRGKCCKKLLRYNGYPNKVNDNKWIIQLYFKYLWEKIMFLEFIKIMICIFLYRCFCIQKKDGLEMLHQAIFWLNCVYGGQTYVSLKKNREPDGKFVCLIDSKNLFFFPQNLHIFENITFLIGFHENKVKKILGTFLLNRMNGNN